jgi:hypothetical protein
MAKQVFANNAASRLAAALTAGATSFSITSGDGALFPTLSGGNWFIATLISADGTKEEIVKVTARATDTFTVTRAFEDATRLPAVAFAANDFVKAFATAAALTDLRTDVDGKQPLDADLTAIAGLTSAANKGIQFTGSGTAATYDLTTAGKALLDDADAAAQRTTLGLGTAATLDSDTDVTLAANSDARLATQKAVKAYIASVITGGASDVMIFKGVIDCSANPNYPAADAGNVYKVSVAGKIGGGSGPNVEAGDTLYCITDSTASGTQAGVGANWVIAQVNIDGAALTSGTLAQFAATTSAQLLGVISDETGSGALVFGTGPTLSNPVVGTQTAGDNSTKGASTAYADNAVAKQPEVLIIAVSDETTAITTGTAKVTFRMPFAMTLSSVRASLTTVSSSGIPTVNIKESGTTIFSTKLTIDASELTSQTAATPAVLSDTSLADDAQMTIDIDVAGTGATGLKVTLIGTRT